MLHLDSQPNTGLFSLIDLLTNQIGSEKDMIWPPEWRSSLKNVNQTICHMRQIQQV
jgi:hypothetical protein